MQVFIFDPNQEAAREISGTVASVGLTSRQITTLAEFISALQQGLPRLIICEARMDGYEDFVILEHVKKNRRLNQIPVIICTAQATRENIIRARQLGASGFVPKPFENASLIKQVKLALNIHDLDSSPAPVEDPARKLGTQQKLSLKAINDERLKSRIMQKIEEIPSLPAIVYKIMDLVNSDKSNASDFEKVVAQDQALTARMLRMANSSFFSLSRKVSTISDAVVYLGHNTIRSLVLGASTSSLFKRSMPIYGYHEDGLWQHANIVASLSKKVAAAAHLTPEETENCYVSGLLHDIGKLILGPFAVNEIADEFRARHADGDDISSIEKDLLGFSHGEIGRILLDKWQLPRNLVETVYYHHEPESSTYAPRETLAVTLANTISNQFGFARDEEEPPSDDKIFIRRMQRLGLAPDWHENEAENIRRLADEVIASIEQY